MVKCLGWVRCCIGCLLSQGGSPLTLSFLPREGITVKSSGRFTGTHCPHVPAAHVCDCLTKLLTIRREMAQPSLLHTSCGHVDTRCADLWLALGEISKYKTFLTPFQGISKDPACCPVAVNHEHSRMYGLCLFPGVMSLA